MAHLRRWIRRCPGEASWTGDGRGERCADGEVEPLEGRERAEEVWERLRAEHQQSAAVRGLGSLEGAADPRRWV